MFFFILKLTRKRFMLKCLRYNEKHYIRRNRMSNTKKYLLTRETYDKYVEERAALNTYLHVDIAKKIQEARAQGDLSENADYDAAMDEQAEVDSKIKKLDEYINNAEIVDSSNASIDKTVVNVGSSVKVLDTEYDEEDNFLIVGSTEANSREGKISNESPVGKALLGHKEGDTVVVELPNGGTVTYKVLNVQFEL